MAPTELTPLLVSVREARRLLGNIGANKFWQLTHEGEFGPLLGSSRKRFVRLSAIRDYVDREQARQVAPS
jgi:hypothetical protein